ncbi:MAG: MotA/TolQ/ExbB proton channel family protein [Proteobacteria bacterium]|nr:MotA/TolQ/ExbB proton channel family protein [Pseudomonadota bacterium]MBW3617693.1 MotA/TolQ/ExbB proton channel family protein [Pseudomonadota bacterium]
MLEFKGKMATLAFASALALTSAAPTLALAAAPAAAPTTGAGTPAGAPTDPGATVQAGQPAVAPDAASPATASPATDNDGDGEAAAEEPGAGEHGKITPISMFMGATAVVKVVMIGLLLASALTWTLLFVKLLEFNGLNRKTDRFLEAFRGARSIQDMGRIATSEEFAGNPLADMAGAAAQEVELSRQAGLNVSGEHRDSTISRAQSAVGAVQSGLAKRLSGGMQFLASTGSGGPFIGLFGTVYGIMNSFIGIAESNTTNLAVVAPGIAEALLATGIGLFAAIPAVIMYNYFQTRIAAFGTRTDGFVAELMNALSRQLDKGA